AAFALLHGNHWDCACRFCQRAKAIRLNPRINDNIRVAACICVKREAAGWNSIDAALSAQHDVFNMEPWKVRDRLNRIKEQIKRENDEFMHYFRKQLAEPPEPSDLAY